MPFKILVINPGSTSTKIAYYEDDKQVYLKGIDHSAEDLAGFDDIIEQEEYRTKIVRGALGEWGIDPKSLSCVMGRGNMLPHMTGGGYVVEEKMVAALRAGKASPHASNIASLIAYGIANPLGIPAYIYDSVTADEYAPIAKITGIPGVVRESMNHVLNSKAMSHKYAQGIGKKYEDLQLIVVHMGGGVTIGVHDHGKIVDSIRDDAGPFSPERAGSIPLLYVVDMCYSGEHTKKEMIRYLRGFGGLKAYLGTADAREIEKMIEGGNDEALKLYQAQAYQIAKGIGEMAPVLNGVFDAIILTGGMAYSDMLTGWIEERVKFIAPVVRMPGESEMDSLAQGAIRLLKGEPYHVYG
ncbi:MAG: butyrate kinase [Clostridiales Family XIII bacterium]|jgi:butyrate kinase|nr:butyrate kinase [Clostridiales Family XIII bacterium]